MSTECDLTWLIGRSLIRIEFFGHGLWRFGFGDETEIRADCPWRILRAGALVLSSEDHGHRCLRKQPIDAESECRTLIDGAMVRSAEVREESLDFVVVFESGARLELIALSSGDQNWEMVAPGGIATQAHSGSLAVWQRDAELKGPEDGEWF